MSKYKEAIERYTEALDSAHRIAHDPFKAPEQNVEEARALLDAIWNLMIEYAVMMRTSSD